MMTLSILKINIELDEILSKLKKNDKENNLKLLNEMFIQ